MLRSLLATIAVSFAAGGARATDDYVPCNETIRFCDGQRAALTRAIYGLEPIHEPGPDAVRVIYADDYRRPMPAIVVERTAGGGALLRLIMLRNPPLLGHSQAEPFKRVVRTAMVARTPADQLFTRAALAFDAPEVLPEPVETNPNTVSICIHPRSATVEVRIRGRWVVRERNTCDEDELIKFAFELGNLAVAHRPECTALDPRAVGWVMYRLAACGRLDGDLRAAASALNVSQFVLGTRWDAEQARLMAARLSPSSRLDWNGGEWAATGEEIAPALTALTATGDYSAWFSRVEGVGPNAARAFGTVRYHRDGEGAGRHESGGAEMEVSWVREPEGPWRISAWTVGKFEADEYE